MDRNKLIFLIIGCVLIGMAGGYRLGKVLIKPEIVEKEVIKVIEYDDPALFIQAVKEASAKYGIKEEVFFAIRDCEGGHLWTWSGTSDGGYFQINWKTAKNYGAVDLKDLIDPRLSADLAGKILQKEGIDAWVTKKCIIDKLIKIEVPKEEL